ncbi:2,5-diketo-D-gluconic acid reductase [Eikenella longinqua]|uniref:2,5-diketo-D-gluconic acid reductase n=1 Tax=Eikenella longinqua TaxID=1795827 RepID=A0A1A9RZB0_9NEIS|nr:aldo/keto reductase [Eikenella longinqua]OAM29364.1 2,5-diketo-D-gluconic acid reductase [Eikenella longinqua]
MHTLPLANSVTIPLVGFGVYQIAPEETARAVADAVQAGYRHIDTAQVYLNETEVGQGIAMCGVPREELFVTTKIWVENAGEAATRASLDRSFKRLNLDYIDMVLIHQPYGDVYGTWRALEEAQAAGRIRAIGVSNFAPDRAVDLGTFNRVMPQLNQIGINPFRQRADEIAALQAENIAVSAWSPFAEGQDGIFQNPVLSRIGAKYDKSVAQVIIRWLVEQNIIVLSKSTKPERMAENLDVFDFALSDDDKAAIATLDGTFSTAPRYQGVERVKWMAERKFGQ